MAKIKIKVKAGTNGKPLGQRIAEYKAQEGASGKEIYRPKAKLNVHIHDGRQ